MCIRDSLWIFDTLSAIIHPRLACLSLAQALKNEGCEFLLEGKNQGKVVWATGVHDLSRISKKLGNNFGNGVKGQAALFKLTKSNSAQLFAETLHLSHILIAPLLLVQHLNVVLNMTILTMII